VKKPEIKLLFDLRLHEMKGWCGKMKPFMDENFLLGTETAKRLFEACKSEPIFDYHCHLSPKEIYENKPFENIAALWLSGDHYKWRVMRACGIDESYITGDAPLYEKFKAWAEILPYCVGNPLYHWTHLELQRYFGIHTPLSPETADQIWEKTNLQISGSGFTPRGLIKKSNVAALCTTDDPVDTLDYHRLLAEDTGFDVKVLPAFRPDMAFTPTAQGFRKWIADLAKAAGMPVGSFADLKAALSARVAFFVKMGCVASDHSFAYLPFRPAADEEIESIYQKALEGGEVGKCELEKYQTALLTHLCAEYSRHHVVMELHLGAIRNNSAKMLDRIGPNTGYDSVNDHEIAESLSGFLSSVEKRGALPKTVFFTLNPKDNYVLSTMAGNFQSSGIQMQFGTAWWFNDHISGMKKQMRDLANTGVLGKFIGMLTDSRSFTSYPRHEYFRRILCGWLGETVENGEYPADFDMLSKIVRGISFENAAEYFGLK
jgi:Glucuronate isomerase